MVASYDDAVVELFQAPHGSFVAERKRLAGELKASGDKVGATRIGKISRPPISAWTVNQLWWHARDAFDTLLVTASRLRDGELSATPAHREAIAALRARAAAFLSDAGHAATESTLRRVATTLSSIAATGSFEPDRPGTLADDRDPPGFEAAGAIAGLAASVAKPVAQDAAGSRPEATSVPDAADAPDEAVDTQRKRERAEAERARQVEARELAEAAAARNRAEEAKAKQLAERRRHEAALRTAAQEVERKERDVARLRKAVAEAEASLEKSRAVVTELEAELAALVD